MRDSPPGSNGRHEREHPASLLRALTDRLRELARRRDGNGTLRDALEEFIEEHEEERDGFTEQERALLLNALSFGELEVADVMVPRPDIKAVEVGAGLAEVVGAMRRANHTRLPVYRETLDDVAGIVHVKDLLAYWGDGAAFDLEKILRPVLFVPPSMRVVDLLLQMRDTRVHMAVVVDEYGGTDGLATVEDLVEEIIGEIQDEHDKILPPRLMETAEGAIEADGRVDIEELEERLGLRLLEEDHRDDVHTVGGLLFTLLDRVPTRGEIVRHPAGVEFEVLEADPRRIKRVRVLTRPATAPEAAATAADGGDDGTPA
jgi:magnesium and cobalt transporter